jgi:quercetin dioxygenase-like cupin family protein
MANQALAADTQSRKATFVNPDDENLTHLALVGNTYTILISGSDTAGRYALIDMQIPPGGSNLPHRHDFEEMFHVLEGEILVTIRGETSLGKAGETVNIPALAPHSFTNAADHSARLLCLISPAGLEEYFAEFANRVVSRTAPAPDLSDEERRERMQKAFALASKYGIEML